LTKVTRRRAPDVCVPAEEACGPAEDEDAADGVADGVADAVGRPRLAILEAPAGDGEWVAEAARSGTPAVAGVAAGMAWGADACSAVGAVAEHAAVINAVVTAARASASRVTPWPRIRLPNLIRSPLPLS
jgi:hypothetical protein